MFREARQDASGSNRVQPLARLPRLRRSPRRAPANQEDGLEFFEILMDTSDVARRVEIRWDGPSSEGCLSRLMDLVSAMTSPYVSRDVISRVRALGLPRNLLDCMPGVQIL